RRHTRFSRDWSSDVCSSDLDFVAIGGELHLLEVTPPESGSLKRRKKPVLRARALDYKARRGRPRRGRPVFRHEWRRKPEWAPCMEPDQDFVATGDDIQFLDRSCLKAEAVTDRKT